MAWFQPKAECPVDPATRDWLDRRWAWLTEQFGRNRVGSARVVLPCAEDFPDPFSGNIEDIHALFNRVCGYMDINPAAVELGVYSDRNPLHEGEWRQGTAGLYHEEGGKVRVWIEVANLDDPLGLVATMAHEIGHVHLLGHGRVSGDTEDHEPLTDLLTVFFGLGVITANATIRERYWDAGAVSGWSMARRGYLTMPQYGYALALFARDRGEDDPGWARRLRPDVGAAFSGASRFLAAVAVGATTIENAGLPPVSAAAPSEAEEPELDVDARPVISGESLLSQYRAGERNFCGLDASAAQLKGVDLTGCDFTGAAFCAADLSNSRFAQCDFCDSDFEGAVCHATDFQTSNCRGADFCNADLSGANFSDADVRGCSFTGCELVHTVFTGTIRNHTTDFSNTDVNRTICETDLSKENMRGTTPFQSLQKNIDRISFNVAHVFAVSLSALIIAVVGALVGDILGRDLGVRNLDAYSALVGAIVGAALANRTLQTRRQATSGRQSQP